MPWVTRDIVTSDIIGEAGLESAAFNESVLATDPDYIAYLLANKKVDKIKELKGKRDETIGGCVEYTISSTDYKFDADIKSYGLMNNAIAVKDRGNATFFPIEWIDADNISVTVTDVELTAIFDLSGRLYEACYDNYQTHRVAINAAVDQAALDAIDITTGWPTVPYTGV